MPKRYETSAEKKILVINDLIRAFNGKPTFSGSWEEDLDCCLNFYDTLSAMCEMIAEEKLKWIPVMLAGDAHNYYADKISTCHEFDETITMLQN